MWPVERLGRENARLKAASVRYPASCATAANPLALVLSVTPPPPLAGLIEDLQRHGGVVGPARLASIRGYEHADLLDGATIVAGSAMHIEIRMVPRRFRSDPCDRRNRRLPPVQFALRSWSLLPCALGHLFSSPRMNRLRQEIP
jgi:hypothetical protein